MKKLITIILLFIVAVFAAKERPLPRFASLRSSNINTHVGPGKQYPIEWHYQRQFMPVEILAEFDNWRQVKDVDGAISWVHMSLLSGKRYGIIIHCSQSLKDKPKEESKTIAHLEEGALVLLKKVQASWIYVEAKNESKKYSGWLRREQLWGLYPHENVF